MTMMETGESQRLGWAMQAAMRTVHRNGHGSPEWSSQSFIEPQLEQVRYRLKETMGDRLVHRVFDGISDVMHDRVREVIRERFSTELRNAMLGAQPERGLDFTRIEKQVTQRLTDAITERLASSVHERVSGTIRERISEVMEELQKIMDDDL